MEISYIWKMIRKIWRICLCHVHACLSKIISLFRTNYVNGIWLFTYEVWIWTLGSNQLHLIWFLVALAQTQAYCHVMIMHHIVHFIDRVFFLCCRCCPLSIDVVSTMRSMTPMKNYIIFRSARQAKPPCSFWYNPTLSLLLSFTAIGQQRFNSYMLR